MSYDFNTKEDQPITLSLRVRSNADAYTLTAEFRSHPYNEFKPESPVLVVPVTSNGQQLSATLTSAQVNQLKSCYYNIRAVGTGVNRYIESGRLVYSSDVVPDNSISKDKLGFDVATLTDISTAIGQVNTRLTSKADLVAGVVPDAQIPARLSDVSLNSLGTTLTTGNTIVRRDTNGYINVVGMTANVVGLALAPTAVNHATRKDYVDGIGTAANTSSTVMRRDVNGWTQLSGLSISSVAPSTPSDATRKDYVDVTVAKGSIALKSLVRTKSLTSSRPMVFSGDSHTDNSTAAQYLYSRLTTFRTQPGEGLEGVPSNAIVPLGYNGMSLSTWLGDPTKLSALVALNPQVVVACWLTNDVRTGGLGTNTTTVRNAGANLLRQFIDAVQKVLPGTLIVLRVPTPYLTVNVSGFNYITDGTTTNPAGQAQIYTDAVRFAAYDAANSRPGVSVYDPQTRLFGTTSPTAVGVNFADQIHQNVNGYYMEADDFAKWVDAAMPYNKELSSAAVASTPATPWTAYYRDVEDSSRYLQLGEFTLVNSNPTTYVDLAPVSPGQLAPPNFKWGDLIEFVGGGLAYAIPNSGGSFGMSGQNLRITGLSISGLTVAQGTTVRIYRRTTSSDASFNLILQDTSIRYKKVGRIEQPTGLATWIRVGAESLSGQRVTEPASEWADSIVNGDVVYIEGLAGSFVVGTNGVNSSVTGSLLQINGLTSQDWTPYVGKLVAITGIHRDATVRTVAGLTGTPNAQSLVTALDTPLKAAYAPAARPNTIIPFGTSITNLDNYGGPQYATGTTARGYMAWANVIGGHRWRIIRNAGVSGNDSAQMLARLQADVLTYVPGYCVVESGAPNDIGSAFTLATSISNHKAIYDQLKAAGIRVVVCTPLPYGLADTTANRQFISALRKWMITYAREQGHLLCDWHAVVAASDGSGLWPVGWSDGVTNGQNGVHPMAPAAKAMGAALAATLRYEKADFAGLWLPGSNADPYNLMLNGMMTGTSGTPSPAGVTNSGLATSWGAYNNGGTSAGTLSKVARTDGVAGEWQQFQATTGNADGIKLQQQNTAVGTDWSVGDTVLAVSEWQADSDWVGGLDLSLTLSFYNTGNVQTDLFRPSADIGIGQPPNSGVHMVFGVVPAATSRLQVNPYCRMGAGGTIRWGRTGLYNLTRLAALGIIVP